MRRLIGAACCLLACTARGEDERARFRAAFPKAMERHGVAGAGFVLVGEGEPEYGWFGEARRETGLRAGPAVAWHWASITKTFTAIAILQLRERGMLSLDDPAIRHLPELRDVHGAAHAVTIRHLLAHTAGFRGPTWPWGGDRPWHPFEPTRWAQVAAMLPYTEILFPPGSRHRYSNLGYVFLGRIVERLAGEDYEVYVDKNILKPLGMHRSYFDRAPYHLAGDRAAGYYRNERGFSAAPFDFDSGITVSNSGLNAPLPDMARYLAFLAGRLPAGAHAPLPRAALAEMWSKQAPLETTDPSQGGVSAGRDWVGLGFFLHQAGGRIWVGHGGQQGGFVSRFFVDAAGGRGHAIVLNTDFEKDGETSAGAIRRLEEGLLGSGAK